MSDYVQQQPIDWSFLYQNRKDVQKRFGKIWDLPLRKRHHQIIEEYVGDNLCWLEIGAGSRNLKEEIEKGGNDVSYKSYDIDSRNFHDFYELEHITGEYDRICMFEIIEHVSLQEAGRILNVCHRVLKKGGKIIISTPNVYYPPAFLRDVTHITPWAYDELGGFLQMNGFQVENIFRMYHDAFIRRIVTRSIMHPLHKLMGIDYSKQIILVATAS